MLAVTKESSGDPRASALLRSYFQTMQKIVEDKAPSALYWYDLLKRGWLKYLYPTLYAKHRFPLSETSVDSYKPVWDPQSTDGIAPPAAHV